MPVATESSRDIKAIHQHQKVMTFVINRFLNPKEKKNTFLVPNINAELTIYNIFKNHSYIWDAIYDGIKNLMDNKINIYEFNSIIMDICKESYLNDSKPKCLIKENYPNTLKYLHYFYEVIHKIPMPDVTNAKLHASWMQVFKSGFINVSHINNCISSTNPEVLDALIKSLDLWINDPNKEKNVGNIKGYMFRFFNYHRNGLYKPWKDVRNLKIYKEQIFSYIQKIKVYRSMRYI
jgi:hypothetical protein